MAKVTRAHREAALEVWRRSNDPASGDFGPELLAEALAEAESRGAELAGGERRAPDESTWQAARWLAGWVVRHCADIDAAPLSTATKILEAPASAQPAPGEAMGAWVAVEEWPEEAGCVAIGYDVFYGRVGEVERSPGKTRWVFIDCQKDDCDVTMVRPLPPPPAQVKP